jgi:biotin carboxyl carrier protein
VEFRRKALARLQSPEELDLPVRLARPQGWLVLSVAVVVLAVAAVWAVKGTVSAQLDAPGVLTHGEGSYVLQSPLAGQVVDVGARPGQLLAAGAPLLDVRTPTGVQPVRAVAAGRVVAVLADIGAVVTTGTDVATLERVRRPSDPLLALLYVPAGSGPTVPVGAAVELTVPSAPAARYGRLRGTVAGVGTGPQTRAQLTSFLGDASLAAQLTAKGDPVAVVVRLAASTATRSGYRWSKAAGPPSPPASMEPVAATLRLSAQRPVDWLLP